MIVNFVEFEEVVHNEVDEKTKKVLEVRELARTDVPFETHPHELVNSLRLRYSKYVGLKNPGRLTDLRRGEDIRQHTVKAALADGMEFRLVR